MCTMFSGTLEAQQTMEFYTGGLPHLSYKGLLALEGLRDLTGFTDANWGACKETRRSIGAFVFLFAGGPIHG